MRIDGTRFGSITVEGRTYDHDIIVRLSGKIAKRKKKLSKKLYGNSHTISREEAEFVFEKGCDELILGTGQQDQVRLSPDAAEFFAAKHCRVLAQPTPDAIRSYNRSSSRSRIGLFHVTC